MRQRQRRGWPVQNKIKPAPASSGIEVSLFRGFMLWIALALIIVNVLIYAPVVTYDFVHFDDDDYVYANPNVIAGTTWNGFWWALTTTRVQANWHPLTWLSHMLDAQVFGLNPGGHHATSVLLHIVNSVMFFWLLYWMTTDLSRSAFVAAIFAVHPLHVESVAWISERKDVLSTFFCILTIWAYLKYVREPRWSRYVRVLLFYALGLMSKPMLVTLPFLLLLVDFWPLGRVDTGTGGRHGSTAVGMDWRRVFQLIREKIPLFVLAAVSSVITFVVQRQGHSVSGFDALSLKVRVENALVSYVEYLSKIFWPSRLAAFYPYSVPKLGSWVAALFGLIVLSAVAITLARRYSYFFVGWFWFLGTLVPVIGLVQVGRQSMADRYTYIPLIGVSVMVAWGVPDILRRLPHRKVILAVTASVVLLVNVITATAQVRSWKNTLTLWGHALDVTKDNYMAHYGLAAELGAEGKNTEAISHLMEALRINPNYAEAHYNLGIEFVDLGKWDEARAHFSEAIRLDPRHAGAHNNLANILLAQGKLREAVFEYTEALRISPDYIDARSNLANALLQQGKTGDAARELSEVLRINPAHANALQMMRQLKSRNIEPQP